MFDLTASNNGKLSLYDEKACVFELTEDASLYCGAKAMSLPLLCLDASRNCIKRKTAAKSSNERRSDRCRVATGDDGTVGIIVPTVEGKE